MIREKDKEKEKEAWLIQVKPGSRNSTWLTAWLTGRLDQWVHQPQLAPCIICRKNEILSRLRPTEKETRDYSASANPKKTKKKYDQQLTHLRQCSEWRNNVLTGVFRVLRSKLPTHDVSRVYKIMWNYIYLHNWRTETVGRNQIQTYFNNLVDE